MLDSALHTPNAEQLHSRSMPVPQTEANLQSWVENIDDVIAIWSLDGSTTYISSQFQSLFGFSPADWVGQSFLSLVHPDDRAACTIANQQVAATGEKLTGIEVRHQRYQRDWIWVSLSIAPITDTSGAVIALQGVLRDIHQSKQQATALRFIVEETASKTGTDFFRSCVRALSEIFQTQYAFIARRVDATERQAEMLVFWTGEEFAESYFFDLDGTPCSMVYRQQWGVFPDQLQAQFPTATSLATLDAESYVGVAIVNSNGDRIGNLGMIDTQPLRSNLETVKSILQLFATRVGAEMERSAAESALKEYAERQALLNRLTNQIRNSLDVDTILKTTIEELYTLLQLDWCAFSWYDPTVQPAQWHVVVDHCFDGSSWIGSYSAEVVGAIDPIVLRLETICIDCAEDYEEPSHRAFLTAGGTQSRLCVPIQTQRDQIGIIICDHKRQPHRWEQNQVELVEAVASQLAIAIDQAELYAQSQTKSQKLQAALDALQRSQAQMIQSEKMSSLGQVVAGVAHEINNPVSFIHGNLTYVQEYTQELINFVQLLQRHNPQPAPEVQAAAAQIELEFLQDDLPKMLASMRLGTTRIHEIVLSLRNFSRMDEAEYKAVDLHEGIDSTLMILQHRLKANAERPEIRIVKDYAALPLVECYAGQLNQVFMNVLVNAIDAIEENDVKRTDQELENNPSQITIRTALIDHEWAEIAIADNGFGIPETMQNRIFDPFFTTKPIGKGTGMGMSISYQIVTEGHGGKLDCFSMPGKGTEFTIQIPLRQP